MTDHVRSSIFTRGAVDLSALRAPSTPTGGTGPGGSPAGGRPGGSAGAGTAAGADPGGSGPGGAGPGGFGPGDVDPGGAGPGGVTVIDVTEATFQTEILQRSVTTPVVIDFWADWCEPCKQLSPVLERLAVEGDGAWVLAKVNVDASPRLAEALQIQGIPAVFVAIAGRLAPGFTGVLPEAQLRSFIAEVLKASGGAVAAPPDPRLDAADDALVNGDLDAAEQAYKKILAESPADATAEAGLAQVGLLRRVTGVDPARVLSDAAARPDDIAAQTLAADVEVLSGQAEAGYQRLIELVRRVFGADREAVRQHLVSLFTVADPDDPTVTAARRALAGALF